MRWPGPNWSGRLPVEVSSSPSTVAICRLERNGNRSIADFIRLSDTVIWLVSEPSVRSEWVNWELDEAAKRNNRLVPVMIRDALPRQLGQIHILPARGLFDVSRD